MAAFKMYFSKKIQFARSLPLDAVCLCRSASCPQQRFSR